MKAQVIMAELYTSKKTGKQSWRTTALTNDGIVVFFAPFDYKPVRDDIFKAELLYNSYNFSYTVKWVRA